MLMHATGETPKYTDRDVLATVFDDGGVDDGTAFLNLLDLDLSRIDQDSALYREAVAAKRAAHELDAALGRLHRQAETRGLPPYGF